MDNASDIICVQRIKAGDLQAFTTIVSRYGDMIFTIVRKIANNRVDAEDITQEVFIKVFKSLEQFREESRFSTWLYRIAYNTTISELRKKKLSYIRTDDARLIENDLITDTNEEDIEIKLRYLEQAMKVLSPDEVFLVTLFYMDEQSVENISSISDLSVSNVKVKLHRIRRKLSIEIMKLMQDEEE
jgi:RNA polymerase sigma-70 factor (ECF subfamily)